jgi:hypothetical protein
MVGVVLLVLALPLIATARDAHATYGAVTHWLEGFGWFVAALLFWAIAAPGPWQRFAVSFWEAVNETTMRRAVGAITLAFGIFLAWIASFEL